MLKNKDHKVMKHQLDPISREAPIAATEEPQNEQRRQLLRKINTVYNFYQKKSCRHGMTGEECKFLHPAPCIKYVENPESSCRAQCKGYQPELCKYSNATRECDNDRCFRTHLKGTRHKQTPPSTQVPSTPELQTNNKP